MRCLIQDLEGVLSDRNLGCPDDDAIRRWKVGESANGVGLLVRHDNDRLVLGEHRRSLDPSGIAQRFHVSLVCRGKHIRRRTLFQLSSDFLGASEIKRDYRRGVRLFEFISDATKRLAQRSGRKYNELVFVWRGRRFGLWAPPFSRQQECGGKPESQQRQQSTPGGAFLEPPATRRRDNRRGVACFHLGLSYSDPVHGASTVRSYASKSTPPRESRKTTQSLALPGASGAVHTLPKSARDRLPRDRLIRCRACLRSRTRQPASIRGVL